MTAPTAEITGRCHCGNLSLTFETRLAHTALAVRACSCSFCQRHGARTTTDPQGSAKISVRDPSRLLRYRFGLRTADFLVCKDCGVYLAAVMTLGDRAYATLNTNTFDELAAPLPAAETANYDGEGLAARRARREAKWTPAEIIEGAG